MMEVQAIRLIDYGTRNKELITLRVYCKWNDADVRFNYDISPKEACALATDLLVRLQYHHLSDEVRPTE